MVIKFLMSWMFLAPIVVLAEDFHNYGEYERSGRLDEYCQNVEGWYQSAINPWFKPLYFVGRQVCYERTDMYQRMTRIEKNKKVGEYNRKRHGLIADAGHSGVPIPENLIYRFRFSKDPIANEVIKIARIEKTYKDYYANEERDHILRPYLEGKFQEIWLAYLEKNQIEEAERVLGDFFEFMCTRKEYRCSKVDNGGNYREPYGRMKKIFSEDKNKGYKKYLESKNPPRVENPLSKEELKRKRDENARNAIKNLVLPGESAQRN